MTTYFSAKELLEPPTERAAFSDIKSDVKAALRKVEIDGDFSGGSR